MRLFAWVLSAAIFFGAFIAARSPEAQGQTAAQRNFGISVQASPQIFATMCALDAAGLDADESALSEMPARLALRGDLLKMQGTATEALRQFYKDHVLESPAETLSRYITFALVAGPPPAFELPAGFDQLPPDVLTIDGFQKVLEDFYQEAHLDLRWAKIEPECDGIGRVPSGNFQAGWTQLYGVRGAAGWRADEFPKLRRPLRDRRGWRCRRARECHSARIFAFHVGPVRAAPASGAGSKEFASECCRRRSPAADGISRRFRSVYRQVLRQGGGTSFAPPY